MAEFCAAQEDKDIKNKGVVHSLETRVSDFIQIQDWYKHKLANPWILPSTNEFLSKIAPEDWDITPNDSKAQESDNIKAKELALLQRDGIMQRRWNGSAEREKLSAQRKIWTIHKATKRNDQLTSNETLKSDRDAENKASRERQEILQPQIKSLQDEIRLDRHRSDLKEQAIALRRDIEEEKAAQR
ncbi:hypothetical protein K438DRAFT_1966601 [Mycena galopus ATCC 62051]|nr:hypothetical protein K438DRAFT_1966601 [Mycena galopus ATCC 62051]